MSLPSNDTGPPANSEPNNDKFQNMPEASQSAANIHGESRKRDRSSDPGAAEAADGLIKPSGDLPELNPKKLRHMAAAIKPGYSNVNVAIIFFDEQDSDELLFSHEIQKMTRVFKSTLGVDRCKHIKIPESNPPGDAGSTLLESIAAFKGESPANELHIFYYGGHGGLDETINTLRASSRDEEGGEYFDWTSKLKDAIFAGASDTLLILNCCEAGGVDIQSSYPGSNHVLAACPVGALTPAHGAAAFSNLLYVAAGFMDTEGFTLEQWFEKTTKTAEGTEGAARPIHQSFDTSKHSVVFEPCKWLARKKERSSTGEDSSESDSTGWASTSGENDGSSGDGSGDEEKTAAGEEMEDGDETPSEGPGQEGKE